MCVGIESAMVFDYHDITNKMQQHYMMPVFAKFNPFRFSSLHHQHTSLPSQNKRFGSGLQARMLSPRTRGITI